MKINDSVYGEIEIAEPVLLELLQSQPVQRVKYVSHKGVPAEFNNVQGFSRYDHCVGAMIAARKLGGSLDEQIAGLLHDVSHTTFSHVIDWVIDNYRSSEGFQDSHHMKFLGNSEVPEILRKYGFVPEKVMDPELFPLIDCAAPGLCVDRLDYSLREMVRWDNIPPIAAWLEDLQYHHPVLGFQSVECAEQFAYAFLVCQKEDWGGVENTVRWESFVRVLRRALDLKIIAFEDFYGIEEPLMKKLFATNDLPITNTLQSLRGPVVYESTVKNPTFVRFSKFRYVDPAVFINDDIIPASKLRPSLHRYIEECRRETKKGLSVHVSVPDLSWSKE